MFLRERMQGFPSNWTMQNQDASPKWVDTDSPRYKAIGNAVSVPVVRWIGERIIKEMQDPTPDITGFDLFNSIDRFGSHTPELSEKSAKKICLTSIYGHEDAPKIKWSSAGVLERGICLMGSVPQWPLKPVASRLVDILDKQRPDEKYFLTPNAAEGILRRVSRQGRQLFKPLAVALENLRSAT